MRKKIIALLMAAAMLLMVFSGCGSNASASAAASSAQTAPSAAEASENESAEAASPAVQSAPQTIADKMSGSEASAEESAEDAEEVPDNGLSGENIRRTYTEAESLPLTDEPITMTAWDYLVPPVMATQSIVDYGKDGLVYKTLQERTGITLDFTTANLLTATDDLALMVAANEMPDITFAFGMFYSGNMDDLIEGDIIVNYKDYEDVMPNMFDIVNNNPDIARNMLTSDGNIALAPNILQYLEPSAGPCVRQDWLDEAGLEAPTTVDQLHDVLTAIQAAGYAQNPLWVNTTGTCSLESAFNVAYSGGANGAVGGFIYEDGQVKYCVTMDGFKDYVQLMHDWYTEGLISPDFITGSSAGNSATTDEQMKAVFFNTSVHGLTDLSGLIDGAVVTPVKRVVMNEGDKNGFDDAGSSLVSKGGAAISGNNPDIELACRLIDYCYSDEGILLENYGVEGESFEYDENGEPVFTDLLLNNPDGLDFTIALIKYTSSSPTSVNINARNYMGFSQEQIDACSLWLHDADVSLSIPGSVWDMDAQTEYNGIYTDVSSMVATYCLQFITGERDMSEWDTMIADVNTFDIDRMVELYQTAVDDFLSRS
ncbi:MAG: extracellular solute-binding protein [Oscillospiraceae bacterium]|nr:extracellular solute-binding protein [Oscillospiraceae bacterium]